MTQRMAMRTYRTFDALRANEDELARAIVHALYHDKRITRSDRERCWAPDDQSWTNVLVEMTDDGAVVMRHRMVLRFQRYTYPFSTDTGYRLTGFEMSS